MYQTFNFVTLVVVTLVVVTLVMVVINLTNTSQIRRKHTSPLFPQIGAFVESNQHAISDLATFSRCMKLKSFQPFATAAEALENINAISEHR